MWRTILGWCTANMTARPFTIALGHFFMAQTNVLKLLDRPIAFHRSFVDLTGSVTAALMLSQAVYWSQRSSHPDGWFWKTQAEWETETGMGRYEQETARRILRDFDWWSEERRGVPAKLWFHIDDAGLGDALLGLVDEPHTSMLESTILDDETPHSSMLDSRILESDNPTDKSAGIQPTNTEITTKTTSETTDNARAAAVAKIKNLYERNIGLLTPIMLDKIAAAVETYPLFWIEEAIAIAGEAEGSKRTWAYAQGILRNSKDAGMSPYQRDASRQPADSRMQRHSAGHPERYEIPAELEGIIIG